MRKFEAAVVFLTTAIVIIACAFLWDLRDELRPRVHYFWGPYKTELETSAGRVLAIPKTSPSCAESAELRRLSQLNLLRVNGTCAVELTEYSKTWEAKCPATDSEKYHCVFIQVFEKPYALQDVRKGDVITASLYDSGKWTPWVTADRKFFYGGSIDVASAKTSAELLALTTSVSTFTPLGILLTYQWNGRDRWDYISATDGKTDKPFEGKPSF